MVSYQEEFVMSTQVQNNEIILKRLYTGNYKDTYKYFVYWGELGSTPKSKFRLETPTGKNPSLGSVCKTFLKISNSLEYLKFKKIKNL